MTVSNNLYTYLYYILLMLNYSVKPRLDGKLTFHLHSQGITDISKIKELEKLSDRLGGLVLSNNSIKEIRGIKTFTKLEILDLHNNQISEICGLENLNNLSLLGLRNNKISELKNLEFLPNLTHLHLRDNHILEINGLDSLTNLQYLDLRNNNISKIRRFGRHIEHIFLEGNQISSQDLSDFTLGIKNK